MRAYRPDLHDGNGIIMIQTDQGKFREEVISGDQYMLEIEHISQCILEGKQPSYSNNDIIQRLKCWMHVICRSKQEALYGYNLKPFLRSKW